jgi:ankyrin repeat protein
LGKEILAVPPPAGVKTNEMHVAVKNNDKKRLKKLLSKKKKEATEALMFEFDEFQLTPVLWALKKESIDILEMFLDYCTTTKIDINKKDRDGFALIHMAVGVSSEKGLVRLLRYEPVDVKIATNGQSTPLHYFCEKYNLPNCQEPFQLLLDRGANVNARNRSGETPLHKAILNNSVRVMMVEMLLQAGADVNIQTGKLTQRLRTITLSLLYLL